MKNKIYLIIIGVIVVGCAIFWGVMFTKTTNKKTNKGTKVVTEENVSKKEIKPTPTIIQNNWKDEAGFIFQYPTEVKVTQDVSDTNRYTNLKITSDKEKGEIIILAEDTRYNNVDAWVKYDETLKGGNIIETTIGDKPGKKIMFADSGKMIAGAIDDQILFTIINNNTKSEYWQKVFNSIFDSWNFYYPTPAEVKATTKPVPKNEPVEDSGILEEIVE